MSLRRKLTYRSTTLFFFTLLIVILGTYWLFRHSLEQTYNEKLLSIAVLSAHFYLEKDEVTERTYNRIEQDFKKISNESVRLYRANSTLYIADSLGIKPPADVIERTIKEGKVFFKTNDRYCLTLFYADNEGDFVIMVSGTNKNGRTQLSDLRKMLLLTGLVALILHLLLSVFLSRKTFKPFYRLINQVRTIKGQDRHLRLNYKASKDDEISSLIIEFNYLLDRLEASYNIQKNFLRNATHEIKTPLAVIIGDIEVALNGRRSEEEYVVLLNALKKNSLHLRSVIHSLITLSNLEVMAENREVVYRIDEVIWQVVEQKKIEYPNRKIEVVFEGGPEINDTLLNVTGNRDLIFIALNNIADNALKYSTAKVVVVINTLDTALKVSITDTGIGMEPAHFAHIYDMFYRVPESKHIPGHGIGLYLTRQIFALGNITVTIDSSPGKGSTFHISFPAAHNHVQN